MGGVALDWLSADIWFASVQKCLGLPAGMGIMVCSPKAIEKALQLGENRHYNSLIHLNAQMANWQTTHTPNVLGIYLLYRVMLQAEDIHKINNKLKARERWLTQRLLKAGFAPLVENSKLRANTVISIQARADFLKILKEKAQHEGIVLGNGYGLWKNNTFRIANFPALSQDNFDKLWHFLENSIQPICSVCCK
jgi:phosphoserine aminotransferase